MFQAIGSVGLSWVKAHAGIPGNDLADQNAKIAITDGQELNIPTPYTNVRRKIQNYILHSWQRHWEDSGKGVRVKGYVPTVDFNLLTHNTQLLFFSGHGHFPAYLYRFKQINNPSCICVCLGDADHFTFDCPHTLDFHFTRPSETNKPIWFSSFLKTP
ncbi:hypothetical protein AVEN_111816-1 [Araneus ventricosus]|uniref:RNase H type-1 domain-containing protein n=1 Tax=Araneus ventricosus TaxID=182803 RepID=A0A4Y2JL37_ARAVE|nr:hypothetical protein AVEN_111816-1 [Araneus ventricosus]